MENYFTQLNSVNVNDHVEKKNGLSYLSWAWAWAEVKKRFPTANYKIYETKDEVFYFTDGKTAWVKTAVEIEGIEHIEMLPVMDNRNKSIPLESITSFDVNKAIQRSLTKACARHGLGLYIYAGEDLPEEEQTPIEYASDDQKAQAVEMGVDIQKLAIYLKKTADKLTVEELEFAIEKKRKAKSEARKDD